MNRLLIICGPTATGKTSLGLKLADKFRGEIISADSRQVYKGMDIGTGKDLPVNVKSQRSNVKANEKFLYYYLFGNIRVWGLDLVEPDKEFSVAHFIRFARPVIKHLWQERKLPIIIGGTGLYIKALLEPIETINVPIDKQLRKNLDVLSVEELQERLKKFDPKKWREMNKSDRFNPRRLVRAIEVEDWNIRSRQLSAISCQKNAMNPSFPGGSLPFRKRGERDMLIVGLTAPKEEVQQRIDKRVDQRVEQGIIGEIRELLDKGYSWDLPAMSGLGYREWKILFSQQPSAFSYQTREKRLEQEIIEKWKLHEKQYAKRQMTWFKKMSDVRWFDVADNIYVSQVIREVEKWYNK